VTSRGLVDDDIDDLELDVPADNGTDDTSSTSAKPAASTPARKPAARKTAANGNGNGNGRTSAARAKAKTAASAEATVTDGADKDDATTDFSVADVSAEVPALDSVVQDSVVQDSVIADYDPPKAVTEDKAPTQEMAAIDAGLQAAASADAVAMESAAADAGSAPADAESPAMPADEIWTQRTTTKSTSKPVDDWAPVEASQRPYGNVYDVTDVYSAPPMPSDPYTTPAPPSTGRSSSTGRPSFTPSVPGPSVTRDTPSRGTTSVPPTHAYPRPAGTGKPSPVPPAKVAAAAAAAAKPAPAPKSKASVRRSGGRQAHLTIARVEPWSVMKFSFATSLVAFVILFVAVAILYGILSALGVFTSLQHVVTNVTSSQNQAGYNAHTWFSASRVLTYTGLLGVLNVILITALCTIGSVIYNLTSKLMGGIEVTLKETD
jgi:Transmembrane domain of unknown function (DUF3566)